MNYFERAKKAVRDAANVTQTFLTTKAELYRLQQQICSCKEELEFLFAELGRLTYHGSDALAGVRPKDEIMSDINACLQVLADLESAHAVLVSQLEATSAEPEDDVGCKCQCDKASNAAQSFCHKCGAAQTEDSNFCRKCGTKLVKE